MLNTDHYNSAFPPPLHSPTRHQVYKAKHYIPQIALGLVFWLYIWYLYILELAVKRKLRPFLSIPVSASKLIRIWRLTMTSFHVPESSHQLHECVVAAVGIAIIAFPFASLQLHLHWNQMSLNSPTCYKVI